MLAVNLGIQDSLINEQKRNISHFDFAEGSARNAQVKFSDEKADLKAMRSYYLGKKKILGFLLRNVKPRFQ